MRWYLVLALLLTACPPAPVTPPSPVDAGVLEGGHAPTIAGACARLAELSCAESGDTCADDMARTARLTRVDLACIATAPDKSAMRQCAGVRGPGACP